MRIPDFIVEPCSLANEIVALQALTLNLGLDLPNAHYGIARVSYSDTRIIGVIAINQHATIELLFVSPEHRRKGVASALLQWAADSVRALHGASLRCTLQQSPEYSQGNVLMTLLLQSQQFETSDRIKWQKDIAMATPIARAVDVRALKAPEKHSMIIGGKTSADARGASLQIFASAQRDLICYTRDLDPAVLNTSSVLEVLRSIALRTNARLRFLVQHTDRALRDGHRLLELSRRLPSSFDFRCVQAEDLQFASAFIVNDSFGFLTRALADRFDCEGDLYNIAEANRLRRYFDEVWERSRMISEWRRLSL
jgi:GNAT superfamily N-acetyltransferase